MKNDWGTSNLVYRLLRGDAFYAFWISGLVGILVDLDHFLTIAQPNVWANRPFHPALLIIAGGIAFGCGTYLAGLYIKLVLRTKGEIR
jgi:hypothetical protein